MTHRDGLRIAIDGRALTGPSNGIKRYTTELWRAIGDSDLGITGVALGGDAEAARFAKLAHRPVRSILPTNLGWSVWALPRAVSSAGAHLFHAPAYTAPLWGARPLVVTIHDVSYARNPDWYPHRSGIFRQAFYRRSAHRADRIITDSIFSRNEIVSVFGIDEGRIDVVPLGVSPHFQSRPGHPREPVILHVGDLHTRRNLRLLIEVVAGLRPDVPGLKLVLIGADRGELSPLMGLASRLGVTDIVHHLTDVDDDALRDWYQRAAVLAAPSRYEGFGLPIVEAMACGTPVVASRGSAFTEVVGDAGVLLDADDREAWGRTLRGLLDDRDHAAELSAKGVARAATFTWSRTAALTAAVYRKAI